MTALNLFATCNGNSLPEFFRWINQPEEWGFSDTAALTILAPPLADFFEDPAGVHIRKSAPFLYKVVEGDFTIYTQVEVDMKAEADSACIMVMFDELHWAKLCFENSCNRPTIVSVVTNGTSDDCNSQALDSKHPFLRVTRFQSCFAFHYSLDGAYWQLVRYFKIAVPSRIMAGVVSQSPAGQGCKSVFRFLDYSAIPVENIRSGA